jgi:hypothetical protein
VPGTFLFAGPTLARARIIDPALPLAGIDIRLPVKRGDVPFIIKENKEPGTLILVDGLFHYEMAVGHAEIRSALHRGWTVWGLSSMGAIRAREMSALGVKGYGQVYELFCQENMDFRDDEVTLLHDVAPTYAELSEPLAHIRVALAALVERRIIAEDIRGQVVAELENMWFGDRTLPWLVHQLRELAPGHDDELRELVTSFDRYRVKSLDLIRFLRDGTLGPVA